MACRFLRCHHSLLLLIGLTAPGLTFGQSGSGPARSVLQLSSADQIAFLEATMDLGFPEDRADQVTMLVINRSEIAVPVILARLQAALSSQDTSSQFVDTAIEVIAYAGDEQAIRAVGRLLSIDEKRFERYVGRTLTNAANWRNPFGLAYRAIEMSDSRITALTMKWVEASMDSARRQSQWAEAMLDKHGRIPTESDWANDPIASRLTAEGAAGVKARVLGAASEAQHLRERRQ